MEPVDPFHQFPDGRDTTALNSIPIDPSSRAGLTITGNSRSCEKSRRPRKDRAKTGVNAVELEDLLRDPLVLRVKETVRPRPREPLLDQLQVGRDAVIGRVVAGERLRKVEHEIAIVAREGVKALERPIEDVERRLVSELLSASATSSSTSLSRHASAVCPRRPPWHLPVLPNGRR